MHDRKTEGSLWNRSRENHFRRGDPLCCSAASLGMSFAMRRAPVDAGQTVWESVSSYPLEKIDQGEWLNWRLATVLAS